MPCAQYVTLQTEWPLTLRALEGSYLANLSASVTDAKGQNPAGYLIWQLRRAYRHAQATHGEVRGSLPACDQIFAAEVRYHHERKTEFRNVIPALGACWHNLVHERGERFRSAALVRPGQVEKMGEVFNEIAAAAQSRKA